MTPSLRVARVVTMPNGPVRVIRNTRGPQHVEQSDTPIPLTRIEEARRVIGTWPGYRPTSLIPLGGLARDSGIGALWYKDEGERFGVGSFKPMGGAYAVARLVERLSETSAPSAVTVACATDGNHGRAVAWGARLFGCQAKVYVASHVTASRAAAIAGYGAEVTRTSGNHDDAVRLVARDAKQNGWYVISETGLATVPEIAWDVLAGYGAIMSEVAEQIRDMVPTHVFVQAGVGGLAAAMASYAQQSWGTDAPRIVVVEAESADCVFRSIEADRRSTAPGPMHTVMAGLAAGEVSEHAWPILRNGTFACVAIPDSAAIATLRVLAEAPTGDPPIQAGESGVAGLAAVLAATRNPALRRRLELDQGARVLTIGTEGVTDRAVYERLLDVTGC
jgi:diaminopropionate ammonia-lyase